MSARRCGFTLPEVLVAIVFLALVAVTFAGATQHLGLISNRSRAELGALQFLETETERLRLVAYDSLQDGSRTWSRGTATWVVQDSTTFRQVLLETRYSTPTTGTIVDSVVLYRRR